MAVRDALAGYEVLRCSNARISVPSRSRARPRRIISRSISVLLATLQQVQIILLNLSIVCQQRPNVELAKALGCDFNKEKKGGEKDGKKGDGAVVVPPPLNRALPRVMVDGPFGSASEDFFKVWSLSDAL
jgi:hypothetical protein